MQIPVVNLRPQIEVTRAVWQRHLDEMFERQWFILGDQVRLFEQELAAAFGSTHAIGCGNGTDAISLCLRAAGITSPKQEVITTAMTAPFSGIGILGSGARPRFADINPRTLQIDADDAANRITKRTAALMPVHLYGQPCEIAQLARIARSAKLTLIQDAAQAHGTRPNGKPLTAYSPYVCYSFYPTKNLGCLGDGGAICTNSPAIAKRLREQRDGGRRGGQVTYVPGINSRLDEMHACYLRAFLPQLASWNADRNRTAAFYDQALADCPGVMLVERTTESVCHLYVIRVRKRDALRRYLAQHGIGTGIHYPVPMHLHPTYRDCGLKRGDLPHVEKACREVLSLPLWPGLSGAEAEQVAGRVRSFFAVS
jgi:dTDP-3-amino-3,4,6-trideoxy-alpha-D-glucose transaminase